MAPGMTSERSRRIAGLAGTWPELAVVASPSPSKTEKNRMGFVIGLSYVHRYTVLGLRILQVRLTFFLQPLEPLHQRVQRFLISRTVVDIGIHSAGGARFYPLLYCREVLRVACVIDLRVDAFDFTNRDGVVGKVRHFRRPDLLQGLIIEDSLKTLQIICAQRAFGGLDFGLS